MYMSSILMFASFFLVDPQDLLNGEGWNKGIEMWKDDFIEMKVCSTKFGIILGTFFTIVCWCILLIEASPFSPGVKNPYF